MPQKWTDSNTSNSVSSQNKRSKKLSKNQEKWIDYGYKSNLDAKLPRKVGETSPKYPKYLEDMSKFHANDAQVYKDKIDLNKQRNKNFASMSALAESKKRNFDAAARHAKQKQEKKSKKSKKINPKKTKTKSSKK
jgi:hypothetical protein